MFRRKKTLTILELLVSFALLGALLFVLLNLFKGQARNEAKVEMALSKIANKHLFVSKMHAIFEHLDCGNEGFYTDIPVYDTASPNVFMTWENGPQLNYALSGRLKARLFCKEKSLFMQYLDTKEPVPDRLLLKDVDRYELCLFDAERKIWVNHWEKDRGYVPAMIKITLYPNKEKKLPWEMVFFMHDLGHAIAYEN